MPHAGLHDWRPSAARCTDADVNARVDGELDHYYRQVSRDLGSS